MKNPFSEHRRMTEFDISKFYEFRIRMQNKNDTDRLAKELLAALQSVLNKPLPGTSQSKPQSQADDPSILDTIKDFLTQSLPGTKEDQEQPSQPTTIDEPETPELVQDELRPEHGDQAYERDDDRDDDNEWSSLRRKQAQEREEMHRRHELEREAMQRRHETEREEGKFKLERDREELKRNQEREREASKQAHEQGKRGRGQGRGQGQGKGQSRGQGRGRG